ncbi:MAG TPA: serine/threonine-protein kinase [Gemmatimonadaceae bacterium]|nr:serine/threonine-protein kinase [Gemmatimonadaceae bacterium]
MTREERSGPLGAAASVCPVCGARYDAATRFCGRDGAALQPADLLVGRTIDRFRVVRPLATGGMGHVYLAEEIGTGRPCALKVLDREVARDPEMRKRFEREATNHARLGAHPHVCALYSFGTTADDIAYIAMEYVDGEPLSALLRRAGALPPERAARIVWQAAQGLAAAHAVGLVHRDLKPENIMLGRTLNGRDSVTLIDFGIAKMPFDQRQRLTGTGVAVGTPRFMSPEQLSADVVDARSDVYSLALLAFLMLTGVLPFPATSPASLAMRATGALLTLHAARPDVGWPAALQATLDRALVPDPRQRTASVSDFARDLVQAIGAWQHAAARADARERVVPPTSALPEHLASAPYELPTPPEAVRAITPPAAPPWRGPDEPSRS